MNTQLAPLAPLTQQNHLLIASIMESKLTRTELMDFVIDRVRDEFKDELATIDARLSELVKVQLKKEDVLKLLAHGEVLTSYRIETEYRRVNGKYGTHPNAQLVKLSVKLPLRVKMPAYFTEARKEEAKLNKRKETIEQQVNLIQQNRRKARNQLVRTALETTSEGRDILQAVEALKASVIKQAAGEPTRH